jgi:hypothetical protein
MRRMVLLAVVLLLAAGAVPMVVSAEAVFDGTMIPLAVKPTESFPDPAGEEITNVAHIPLTDPMIVRVRVYSNPYTVVLDTGDVETYYPEYALLNVQNITGGVTLRAVDSGAEGAPPVKVNTDESDYFVTYKFLVGDLKELGGADEETEWLEIRLTVNDGNGPYGVSGQDLVSFAGTETPGGGGDSGNKPDNPGGGKPEGTGGSGGGSKGGGGRGR